MRLTIAVPTYNRADDLARLLSSIERELFEAASGSVEILVIDNDSTDGTGALINTFASRIPTMRHLRNDINIGMQGNFVRALNESSGDYTWMIGDDEVLEPGGLATVLGAISTYETPLLVFNYSSEPAPSGSRFLEQVDGQPLVSQLANLKSFVMEKGWLWTLGNLGMVIVENKHLRNVDPAPHMASCFIQAGWYLEALHDQQMAFVNQPVFRTTIKSQTDNKIRWGSDGTLESFHFITNSIQRFIALGIVPAKVPTMFLNACSCSRSPIWNFFLHPIIQRISKGNFAIIEKEWEIMLYLISLLDDAALSNTLITNLSAMKRSIAATQACHENTIWITNQIHPSLYFGNLHGALSKPVVG